MMIEKVFGYAISISIPFNYLIFFRVVIFFSDTQLKCSISFLNTSKFVKNTHNSITRGIFNFLLYWFGNAVKHGFVQAIDHKFLWFI